MVLLPATIIIIFIIIYSTGIKVSVVYITALMQVLYLIGLYIISTENGKYSSYWIFTAALIAYYMGLYIKTRLSKSKLITKTDIYKGSNNKLKYFLFCCAGLLILTILAVIYHYSVVGIPSLSEDVEVLRFQASKSGLFGIPSRIVNFGIYIILIHILIAKKNGLIDLKMYLVALVLALIVMLCSGSKSSLLTLLIVMVTVSRFIFNNTKKLIIVGVALLLASTCYAYYISLQFATTKYGNLLSYFIMRLFTIGPDTFNFIVEEYTVKTGLSYGVDLIKDLLYPFIKLINPAASEMTLISTISKDFYNTPDGSFIVPITPSIFGYLYTQFGFITTIVLSTILGYMTSILYLNANTETNYYKKCYFVMLEYIMFISVTNGNFIYTITNFLMTYIMLALIWYIFYVLYKILVISSKTANQPI